MVGLGVPRPTLRSDNAFTFRSKPIGSMFTHLRSILDYYRRLGFRVALDDLGSGYSGLAVLGDLDPDLIKIDRYLISKAVESPMHRSICESLVQLGKTHHGKLVLAEGVETVGEKELLSAMGVDLFQGYLFGRPAPIPFVPSL